MTRERATVNSIGRQMYFYRDATSVSQDMRTMVFKTIKQGASALGVSVPEIIFVEPTTEEQASYRFPALIVTHSKRLRGEFSKVDKKHVIYANVECSLPEIMTGIAGHLEQSANDPRSDEPRSISGSRYVRR